MKEIRRVAQIIGLVWLVFAAAPLRAAGPESPLDTILATPPEPTETAGKTPAAWLPRPWDGGSLSMGTTTQGYLAHGRELPREGPGYRCIAQQEERELVYGTDELVAAVLETARTVAERYPGALLRVGNLSRDVGGPIGYSASHRAGRDVDLLYFMLDDADLPVEPDAFVALNCKGEGKVGEQAVRFDTPRNWAVVEALLRNPDIEVQFIFTTRCLERKLLEWAASIDVDPALLARAEEVLWKPTGAQPHNDHFHVRVLCSPDDRAAGCVDDGKIWEWARIHPDRRAEDEERLKKALRSPDPVLRGAAVEEIRAQWHPRLAPRLVRLIDDHDPHVWTLARDTLVAMDEEATYTALAAHLRNPANLEVFGRALETLARLRSEGSAWRFEAILRDDYAALDELAPDADTRLQFRRVAASALAQTARQRSVDELLTALADPDPVVRNACQRAMEQLTTRKESPQDDTALDTAWRSWWKRHKSAGPGRWLVRGIRAAGHRLRLPSWSWNAVPGLLSAVADDDPVGTNAHWALAKIARSAAPPYHPDPKVRAERWRGWWWGLNRWRAQKAQSQ